MAGPTILKGSDHFFINLHEGNDGGQRVGNFVPFTDNGTIAKSCIFNDDDTPRLYRQISAGNRKTYTISLWFKLGKTPSADGAAFWSTSPSNDSGYGGNPSPYNMQFFQFVSGALEIQDYNVSGNHYVFRKRTNRTFKDSSKFYHLLMAVDTTQSTAADRVKLYIDGEQITSFNDINSSYGYPDEDEDTSANQNTYYDVINIGYDTHWDGYIAEFNFVDGSALTPSTFGLTDTSTGRWIPKTLTGITYGTNGYRLTFANSAGQTIGDDTSGNTNDFTVTNLAASDISTDSPTQNHMTFDPLRSSDWTFTEGNLQCAGTPSSGAGRHSLSNMIMPKSGKYYFEMTVDVNNDSPRYFGLAKADASVTEGTAANVLPRVLVIRNGGTSDGHFISDGSTASANGFATTNGTVINFALDADNEKLYVGKDGSYYDFEGGSGNPTNGTGATFSNIYKSIDWRAINMSFSTGSGGTSHKVTWNFGGKTFAHTAPTDFVALQQDNLPETGKGVPDFVWIKNRTEAYTNMLFNSSRGVNKRLRSDTTSSELTYRNMLNKFLKGGCQVGEEDSVNKGTNSFVSWNWVANGGTTSANTDGSGATLASTIQANQTAGFSIVEYTGNATAGAKVAHGLSAAPKWLLVKRLDDTGNWYYYHASAGATKYQGGTNAAFASSSATWNNTAPTSSVFSLGSGDTNTNSANFIAFCWNEVRGYSKFGSYLGNANADGPFVYTGFKPAYVLFKADNTAYHHIADKTRQPFNPNFKVLYASLANAEANNSSADLDFLSNGFKIRQGNNLNLNYSDVTTYYMAFAEHPFAGTSNINPITAH